MATTATTARITISQTNGATLLAHPPFGRCLPAKLLRKLSRMAPDPKRWQALAVLSVAYLMVVLDVSIVNVALPSIQKSLGFSSGSLEWVVSGYALTFGGFLLL